MKLGEPRRVAAVSMAKRVAFEIGTSLSHQDIGNSAADLNINCLQGIVGYQIRYDGSTAANLNNRIKFMTDGILLQEAKDDILLSKYSVIVIDEAHERNLNGDILLGILSRIVPLRAKLYLEGNDVFPLRVVIMSATLRVSDFTENEALFPSKLPGDFLEKVEVCKKTRNLEPRELSLLRSGYFVNAEYFGLTNSLGAEKVIVPSPRVVDVENLGKNEGNYVMHFSRKTAVKDYVTASFRKILQIHRKLPKGGILVFLPGQKQINQLLALLRSEAEKEERQRKRLDRLANQNTESDASEDFDFSDIDSDVSSEIEPEEANSGRIRHILKSFQRTYSSDEESVVNSNQQSSFEGTTTSLDSSILPPKLKLKVLPLYARLELRKQNEVFETVDSNKVRLVVVATNVAETSITIPGIRYVVDSGRQNLKTFLNAKSDFSTRFISKASAKQRAGRSGRWVLGNKLKSGHCYTTYSSNVYEQFFPAFEKAEIEIANSDDVVLYMHHLGIRCPSAFPFPTQPSKSRISASESSLFQIGALKTTKEGYSLTNLGEQMGKYPVSSRLGKMLALALSRSDVETIKLTITLVAIMSLQNPFLSNLDNVERTGSISNLKEKRSIFHSERSDFLYHLNAVGGFLYLDQALSRHVSQFNDFCARYFMHKKTLIEIRKLCLQLWKLVQTTFEDKNSGQFMISKPINHQSLFLQQVIISSHLDRLAKKLSFEDAKFVWDKINENVPKKNFRKWPYEVLGTKEFAFVSSESVLFQRNSGKLPDFICFAELETKELKNFVSQEDEVKMIVRDVEDEVREDDVEESSNAVKATDFTELTGLNDAQDLVDLSNKVIFMKGLTEVNPRWLHQLSKGTQQICLKISDITLTPPRFNDTTKRVEFLCSPQYGSPGSRPWILPDQWLEWMEILDQLSSQEMDSGYICILIHLLNGDIFPQFSLQGKTSLRLSYSSFDKNKFDARVGSLVNALRLKKVWSEEKLLDVWRHDSSFLMKETKFLLRKEFRKTNWASLVKPCLNKG
eukprot:maker-scaffold_12-augustus-gene-5.74-mRNA-1 protein AED:0.05 eAED:0.08 QI:0/0/0/1/0/0.5/2/0/1018